MRNRIIVAVVFVPVLLVVLFFLPPFVFGAVIAFVCAVSAYELSQAIGVKESKTITVYAVFTAVLIPVGVFFEVGEFVYFAVLMVLLCFAFLEAIIAYSTQKHVTFVQILAALFSGAIIPLLLSSLVGLRNLPDGHIFVLLPIVSAFVTDAGAYFAGVFFGKHKAFPDISPKKTVEGYIGGIVVGTAATLLYGYILASTTPHEVRFGALCIYGIVGALITGIGDLAFSLIKREFGVKDFGSILPGHGGMMDRFDSMVFTAPAMYLMVYLVPAVVMH